MPHVLKTSVGLALWTLASMLAGCDGTISGGPDIDAGFPHADSSAPDGALTSTCGPTGDVILYFESTCAGCHQGSRAFPDLTRDGLPALASMMSRGNPSERMLVPSDPESSWLYRKMAHTQGPSGGAGMPLGSASPSDELGMIERWIQDGAPTDCDDLAPPVVPYDPNALDPAELFTCEDPSAERSSPARIRRIDDREFNAVALGRAGTNPLAPPAGTRYSTYADDISVDPVSLSLLSPQFPGASQAWSRYDPPAGRTYGVYRTDIIRCMEGAAPDDACIDRYVELLFIRGAAFRSPTPEEFSRLRAFLTQEIATEPELGQTRQQTLELVAQAARLSSTSLFRPELGVDAGARRRLSDDEIALALGHLLSANPVGQLIRQDPSPDAQISEDDPDGDDLAGGRLGLLRTAAEDGTIGDAATRIALLRHYAGGVVAERRPDLAARGSDNPARGQYWIATNLLAFFREWLDYDGADTAFKEEAGATSTSEDDDYGPSFGELRSSWNGSEGTLEHQLDDLIARLVIETDGGGGDIFEELLTTTLWHLPSNLGSGSTIPCESADDCDGGRCPNTGFCSGSTSRSHVWKQAVFGIRENVGLGRDDRWVEMNPAQRMGVLTHPAWLAAHGANFEDDASLIERGLWIREQIFCQSFGSLDDVRGLVAMLPERAEEDSERLSARSRVYEATEDPSIEDTRNCFGCHQYMNSLGYPFELFNHAGFERGRDHGHAPNGATLIDNLPDPALNRAYDSPFDLVQAIATSAYAKRGFVRHAFRFFMGRDEVLADGCTLVEMEEALNRTGSYLSMLEALVASDTFIYRHMPEGGE